jgi:hypothetical protein
VGGRVVVVAGVAAAGVLVAGGVVAAVADVQEVPPSATSGSGTPTDASDACDGRPVLSSLTGTFSSAGGDYSLDGTAVDFGPAWYLADHTGGDLDGDGQVSTLAEELAGLDARVLTLEVDRAGRGGDRDVFTIGGVSYRSADGCPPEWAGGPGGGGPPAVGRIPGGDERADGPAGAPDTAGPLTGSGTS